MILEGLIVALERIDAIDFHVQFDVFAQLLNLNPVALQILGDANQ